jgi:hypothetical protein
MTIATRIVRNLNTSTTIARVHMSTQCRRSTIAQSPQRPKLMKTEFGQIELIKTPPQYRADVKERCQDLGELPPLALAAASALALASASALCFNSTAKGVGVSVNGMEQNFK